jgi:hypothetical protein
MHAPEAELLALAHDPDDKVRMRLAWSSQTPASVLTVLSEDASAVVRSRVAENPNTPPELLAAMAQDSGETVRMAVAANPNTPLAILIAFARVDSSNIRESLGANPKTPSEVLSGILAVEMEDPRTRANPWRLLNLARNPSTPVESLRLLSTQHADVRAAIARNPSCPSDLLATLARDKAKSVRTAVADNPAAPADARSAAQDANASARSKKPSVADRVDSMYQEGLDSEQLSALLEDRAMGIRIAAAIRAAELGILTPEDCARLLKQEPQNNGARHLHARWSTTGDNTLFQVMLAGRFEDQLTSIAQDPETPIEMVRTLFEAKIPGVAWFFATREGVTADELDTLSTAPSHSYPMWSEPESLRPGEIYNDGFVTCYPQVVVALHPLTRSETLTKMRKARSKYVRAALAQRPDPEALPILAGDKESTVRAAVAGQTETSLDILEVLAMDPEREVRAAVHANPNSSETARAAATLLGT